MPPKESGKKDAPLRMNLFSASLRVLGKPIKMVCDPIAQVCYPILEEHWKERYRKPWPVKYARRMLILDITLLTIIATLIVTAMIYAFVKPFRALPALVNIDVVAPRAIVSGELTEYDVTYRNDSEKNLGCAVLRVHLPAGTILEKTPSAPAAHETTCPAPGSASARDTVIESDGADGPVLLIPVGSVTPHGHDIVRVHARTYGATGSHKVMTSELLYWEEANTAPSRLSTRTAWDVERSIVSLTAQGPSTKTMFRGQDYAVDFSIASLSSVGPLTLHLRAPDDFTMNAVRPEQTSPGTWTMAGGAPHTLHVQGRFSATPGPKPPSIFTLDAYMMVGEKEILVESLRWNADPHTSGFTITQEVVSPGRNTVLPGEEMRVAVHYRNNSAHALAHMTVTLAHDAQFIEAASPEELRWDETNAPELASIAPGAEGTLTATFRVVRDVTKAMFPTGGRPQLHLTTDATYVLADQPNSSITVTTRTENFAIASALRVQAAGLYYTKDGEQLGIGPLPPKVGTTTKYRVFFDVANSSGEADGVTVEATLPANVEWTGKYSVNAGQAIDWLPSTRTVRWEIGTLAPYTNSEGEHLGASFEVALTPSAEDAGSAPTLVTSIALSGKDAVTGLTLHAEAEPITTDLPFDKRAIGKGAVEK